MTLRMRCLIGLALGLATTSLLAFGHRDVGYVRDEGIYFAASRHYGAWAADVAANPRHLFDARARDKAFAVNREHPALMKLAAGVSARLFARPGPPSAGRDAAPAGVWPWLSEGAAMRLPAQLLAGLGAALLWWVASGMARGAAGALAGLCAVLWMFTLPRVWFHAGLHCFDVPVAVATLVVVLVYRAALQKPWWSLALGPALGLAISIKHNALFIPVLLAGHYALTFVLARRWPQRGQWLPLPFLAMAVLAPLTAVALWPWLWSDTGARLAEYAEFHRFHAYYNTEYFGINYNRPPLPWHYPLVLTWATVPLTTLVLASIGLGLGLRRAVKRVPTPSATANASTPPSLRCSTFTAPLAGLPRRDGLLWAIFAVFPLALIAWPTIPIFGGTKHWLTAYPFLAVLAAHAWTSLVRGATLPHRWRHAPILGLVLLFSPGVWACLYSHPYGLSQYAAHIGGPRGAAELGLLRGFWGHAVPPSVLDPQAPATALYVHDLHELARQQYLREGRWPAGSTSVTPQRARAALLFHERHMLSLELQVWEALQTTAPREVLTLADVPLTSLYHQASPDR